MIKIIVNAIKRAIANVISYEIFATRLSVIFHDRLIKKNNVVLGKIQKTYQKKGKFFARIELNEKGIEFFTNKIVTGE